MPIDLNNIEPLDPGAAGNLHLLEDLQGNILKGHGRTHAVQMFLRFKTDDPQTGYFILAMIKERMRQFCRFITSAKQQYDEGILYRDHKIVGSQFVNFFLTANGYRALGYSEWDLPGDARFRAGMQAAKSEMNDPDVDTWEPAYRQAPDKQIHAMILVADDDENYLRRSELRILNNIIRANKGEIIAGQTLSGDVVLAEVIKVERGTVLRNDQDESIEQFGFVDGRSQPLFLKNDLEDEARKGGTDHWSPFAPLSLILVPDRLGQGPESYGSYLVFRKLEQNVKGFKELEQRLAQALGLEGEASARAGALIMGRFRDGTPVAVKEKDGLGRPVLNNFNYDDDPQGTKCPLHAHIRLANPRGSSMPPGSTPVYSGWSYGGGSDAALKEERRHSIARRGVPYDDRERDSKGNLNSQDTPSNDVGLLFMCFQSDIGNQFEYLQKAIFSKTQTGGTRYPWEQPADPAWPIEWGKPEMKTVDIDLNHVITLKGGEYFFAPSISFLRNIGSQ